MPQRPPWVAPAGLSKESLKALVAQLAESLADAEAFLREVHREVSFGPVAGAYFPIQLGRSQSPLPVSAVDLFSFGFELRPISFTAVVFGGDATIDLESEGASILTAGPIALLDGVPQTLNSRGDFLVEKVTVDLTLYVDSVDAATPAHLRTTTIGKNLSKVEPA